MNFIDSKTFNPEIIYLFDPWSEYPQRSEMHHHDFLEISFILEGSATYQFGQQPPVKLKAGNILLFNPGEAHAEWQEIGGCCHELHIGIRNVSLDGLKRNTFPHLDPRLDLGRYQHSVMEKAWQIIEESNREHTEFQLLQKAYVIEILALILRGLSEEKRPLTQGLLSESQRRQQKIVNQTVYYLENHYEEEITIEKLAQDQFVSPTYLSKIFKENIGVGPINYLIQTRLNHAKALLNNQSLPIKEVARQVGYQDAYHFSKSFKKQYGYAPTDYLKQRNG